MERRFDPKKSKTVKLCIKHYIHDIFLTYRLLLQAEGEDSRPSHQFYSLLITKTSLGGKKRSCILLRDIAVKEEAALEIFSTFSRGRVAPENAKELFSELFSL